MEHCKTRPTNTGTKNVDKHTKAILLRKPVFSTKGAGKLDLLMEKNEINFSVYLILQKKELISNESQTSMYYKICIKRTRENLCDLGSGKDFLDTIPKHES